MKRLLKPANAAIAAALLVAAGPATAQLATAIQQGESATRSAAQTQERINQLDDERSDMVREFRTLLQRLDAARLFEMQQARVVESQSRELEALEEQLGRVDEIVLQTTPMMLEMIDAIQAFYAADLPFKDLDDSGIDARAERMERLATIMERADISEAERYRLIIEAYQAEMDYGRTIATYEDTVEVAGEVKTVDVFRYGRVSMVYLTKDRARAGRWDRETGAWEALPDQYRNDILTGIRMARQIAAPTVLYGPVEKFAVGQ